MGLLVATVLTAGLVVIATSPDIARAVEEFLWLPLSGYDEVSAAARLGLMAALVGAIPLSVTLLILALDRRSWRWTAGGFSVLAPVFIYLVADDSSVRRPNTLEEFSPPPPDAARSYEVFLRHVEQVPAGREVIHAEPTRIWYNLGADQRVDPGKPEQFRPWLLQHRAEILAGWTTLAPIRAWWAELARFERIADLDVSGRGFEEYAYRPITSYSQIAAAMAGLQALDGKGDDAFATLQPLVEVSRKLESGSRSWRHTAMARTAQANVIRAANFGVESTPVSAPVRARLAAALTAGPSAADRIRHLLAVTTFHPGTTRDGIPWPERRDLDDQGGWLVRFAKPLTPLLYNSRRTMNALGDQYAHLQDLAARREITQLKPRLTLEEWRQASNASISRTCWATSSRNST